MTLKWLNSLGGPLILLPEELVGHWRGMDGGDYDRACAVDDYVGLVDVNTGTGLVLDDEPLQTCWSALSAESGMLVRWVHADSEASVTNALRNVPASIWEVTRLRIRTESGKFLLFDSVLSGKEVEDSLLIAVRPGIYAIDSAEYRPDAKTCLILHRLRPSDET